MSLESLETLPSIIKSLAQQLAARDTQLKNEQAKYEEDLTSVRLQKDAMQIERDKALRSLDDLALARSQLRDEVETIRANWAADVERVKLQSQSQEMVLSAKLKANFDVERAELTAKIDYLERTATHQAAVLLQAQHDAEDWKGRYTSTSNELRHRADEWATQFSRVARILEELSATRRNSDSVSSPTIVPPHASSSPAISSVTKVSPLKHSNHTRGMIRPVTVNSDQITPTSTVNIPKPFPTSYLNAPAVSLSNKDTDVRLSPRKKESHKVDDAKKSSNSPRDVRRAPPEGSDIRAFPGSRAVESSTHSVLPPDRVIITAHYELKKEEDEALEPFLPDGHNYHEASGSRPSYSRGHDSGEDGEPKTKRRKATARKQNTRRIIHDDHREENQLWSQDPAIGETDDIQNDDGDDFDEMAIGAENNHNEVYGHRRVNVREVNTRERTPPHRPHISHSGSSSKKRKATVTGNVRQSAARKH